MSSRQHTVGQVKCPKCGRVYDVICGPGRKHKVREVKP